MDPNIIRIIFALIITSISVYFISMFIRIRKKRLIQSKLEEYDNMLDESRKSRKAYIKAMEKTQPLLENIEKLKYELGSIKVKLNKGRIILRKLLEEIRNLDLNKFKSDIEERTIKQLKFKFEGKWMLFNGMKKKFCETAQTFKQTKEQYEAYHLEENNIYKKYTRDKEATIRLFREISQLTEINPPKDISISG